MCQFRMKPAGVFVDPSDQSSASAPLAAILYDAGSVPNAESLAGAAQRDGGFAVTHMPPGAEGWAEVLRDGLTFDVRGLSGGPIAAFDGVELLLGVQRSDIEGSSALLLFPGPHLAGAEHLLPVIRVACALLVTLARIASPRAICWNPAKSAVSPAMFEQAVLPWLDGGPFPALALVSLRLDAEGMLVSEGLKFLIGQEFQLADELGRGREHLSRVAIRLIDWLVAHGPVSKPVEAVLAGTGAVFLEAECSERIVARCH